METYELSSEFIHQERKSGGSVSGALVHQVHVGDIAKVALYFFHVCV